MLTSKKMKKFYFFVVTVIFLMVSAKSVAQIFTVTSPTDGFHDYLPPLKSLGSYQFQITVKNNDTISYTVSIDKGAMMPLDSWVTIQNNSIPVNKNGTIIFLLTITIPASIPENDFPLPIQFIAKDPGGTNHTVTGKNLKLVVDNSAPEIITENIDYATSSTVRVTFDGYDGHSSEYSNFNYGIPGSGYQGIKSFRLELKDGGGTVKETKSFDATTQLVKAWVFTTGVSPNTTYTTTVQATDMAGNSGTSTPKSVKTKPGAPTHFIASSISYCRVTLSWDAMPGATSYYVWNDPNNIYSTTATTYSFPGLNTASSYNFNVRAVGADGPGDTSSKNFSTASVTAPIFTSSLTMCSNSQTIEISPVGDATSYDWTVTNPLTINGAYSATTTVNSADVYAAGLSGTSVITVTANTLCGVSSLTATGAVKIGKPVISSYIPLAYYNGSTYNNVCNLQNYSTSMNIQNADNVTWTRIAANPTSTSWYQSGDNVNMYFYNVNQTAVFEIDAANTCGYNSSQFGFKSITCGGGGGGGCNIVYIIYPNPASQSAKVTPNIPAPCDAPLQMAAINGKVSVLDNQGIEKKVLSYKRYKETTIDVSDLKDGLYYVNIFDGSTTTSVRLIVKH